MEDSNVWFYGMKKGDLYVFDAEFDELDSLGPIEPALDKTMDEKMLRYFVGAVREPPENRALLEAPLPQHNAI
jgi:hypothetical protein